MKQVIGHRGAAGLGLENSVAAIKKALQLKLERIEVDVRLTRDKVFVLCHDADLKVMADDERKLADLDWHELKAIPLRDGSRILTLKELLKMVGAQKLIIEVKDGGEEEQLLTLLDGAPKAAVTVASFKRSVLSAIRKARPEFPLYVLEHTSPNDAAHFANRQKLQGIGLNFWLLNPVTYHRARRTGLQVYVYTVNSRFLAWFLRVLYPHAALCSDHPERFI